MIHDTHLLVTSLTPLARRAPHPVLANHESPSPFLTIRHAQQQQPQQFHPILHHPHLLYTSFHITPSLPFYHIPLYILAKHCKILHHPLFLDTFPYWFTCTPSIRRPLPRSAPATPSVRTFSCSVNINTCVK